MAAAIALGAASRRFIEEPMARRLSGRKRGAQPSELRTIRPLVRRVTGGRVATR